MSSLLVSPFIKMSVFRRGHLFELSSNQCRDVGVLHQYLANDFSQFECRVLDYGFLGLFWLSLLLDEMTHPDVSINTSECSDLDIVGHRRSDVVPVCRKLFLRCAIFQTWH